MIYFMNIGTIPEEANYRVITSHGSVAGELSEKFVERLSPRDVFVLGGRSFEFVRSKGMTAYVKEANGRKPTVPSWAGEMLPRSFDLSMDIAEFRKEMSARIRMPDDEAIRSISEEFDVNAGSARSILSYFREQEAVAGFIPDSDNLAVEEYIDPSGNQKLVFHFPFGRRVNDALSRAYAYRMTAMIGANVSVTISDDSFMLGCPRRFDMSLIPGMIKASELDNVLRKSLKDSEIFKLRFRHTAARSFMILRNYMGRPISVNRQQVRSTYLLEMLGDMEGVPVIEETYREVMEDDMDIKNAEYVLDLLDSKRMGLRLIGYSGTPSPFAHSAILSGFSDIVLMEDRSALLRELHRKVLYRALGDSVSEFEFTEDQIIPYYAQKAPRIASKDDIPKLLMKTGPLQAIRERGRNIYTYADEDKKVVDGWVRELLEVGEIATVYMDDVHIMAASEAPYYAAATRKERTLNPVDEDVLGKVGDGASISDIAEALELSDDIVLRSLRKLESMYRVARTDIDGRGKWTFARVEYPELDRKSSTDRIVLRYLDCFAPATVQEVAFALSLPDDEALTSLESLVATEEVSKGRFLISENDQYMLKLDHMRLRSGKKNVFDYDTVERYRLSKGASFPDIRSFFEFYGSAGSELDVYNRVKDFDLDEWYSMRESGELLLGRFVRGKVRYVLKDEGDRYAALRREEIQADDLKILSLIESMGRATTRQLVTATGMDKGALKDAVSRLDRSLLLVRDFDEREDWGTENTYAAYHPSEPEGDPATDLLARAIRAYGPIPSSALRYLVDLPLDVIESMAPGLGAETITVGEGQAQMLVMSDEIPKLEDVPQTELPLKVIALTDPDIGSKWAEIAARYGDKWIYPLVSGNIVRGALELWEMSGCIEIRAMDLDSPELLPEALEAIDRLMGYFNMKGVDIIRIREVLNTDAGQLEASMRSTLESFGYVFVNGFYAKGRFDPWTMTMSDMLSYVFYKQRIARNVRYGSVAELVEDRGYIRGDQELIIRVNDRTAMKSQLERGVVVKMTLSPPYQGYTDLAHASLYRAEKAADLDETTMNVMRIIKDRQPVSKKDVVAHSMYSAEKTSEAMSELSKGSVLYQDEGSLYNVVPMVDVDRLDAAKEIAKLHFRSFGVFSAEGLSSFLSVRMTQVRKVLRALEDEGFLKKGFFLRDDPIPRWMLAEDVGNRPGRFTEQFVLNTQDNLHIYLRGLLKEEIESSRSLVFNGTKVIGSFKGKVCFTGAKVEDVQGSDRALRILKETAQSVGVSLETERQREDDDWDVSEFYVKVNPGA
jgi:ATP-dependent Lhr-like helicase